MTPFLDKLDGLTRPEKLLAFAFKELADERGNVTLEWNEIFELMEVTSKGRIRAMLSHLKQAGLGHGSTNSLVHWQFDGFQYVKTSARSAREYAQYVKTSPGLENDGFQYVKTSDQYVKRCAQSPRGSDHFGDNRGRYIDRYIDSVLEDFSLTEKNLSIYLSESDDSDAVIAMLQDEKIAMPERAAKVAAATTGFDRAVAIIAGYLAEVEAGNNQHTAIGLLKRLTWREDGRYRFPAKAIPSVFYQSDFARRHGLEPPRASSPSRYEIPSDLADIAIGVD